MAQETRREQTVRLPNPSAQPFVSALKTARFFAVLFFWIAMVAVLAHVSAFVLTQWMGLYEMPAASLMPEPAAPAAPAAAPEPAAPAAAPAGTSWLGLFEKSAAAAESGELFPNVKPDGQPKTKPSPRAAAEPPRTETEAAPGETPAGAAGKIVAQPPASSRAPAPVTPEQRRAQVTQYRYMTECILRSAKVIGTISALLLTVTVFLYLQIALLGRLAGIREITRSLFVMFIFLATILPWDAVFEGVRFSTMFDFQDLLRAHAAHVVNPGVALDQVLYFGRFFVMPATSALLLVWSGLQFAGGYGDSVLANE